MIPSGLRPVSIIEAPAQREADEHGGDEFGGKAVNDVETAGRLGRLGLRVLSTHGIDPPAEVIEMPLVRIVAVT